MASRKWTFIGFSLFVVVVLFLVVMVFANEGPKSTGEAKVQLPETGAILLDEKQINNIWLIRARGLITSENKRKILEDWAAKHPDLQIRSVDVDNLGPPDPGGNEPWEFEVMIITDSN